MSTAAHLTVVPDQQQRWWPAVGLHLGLLVICGGCVYTVHPQGWFTGREWTCFGLIGLMLMALAVVGRARVAATQGGRMLLALGVATALYLAYDPLLANLPVLSAVTVRFLGRFEPNLATLGVFVLLLTWALRLVTQTGCPRQVSALCIAVLTALGLVLGTAFIMQVGLGSLYDLSGATSNAQLAFRVLQAAVAMLAAMEMSGAAGVGAVAHGYVGLAVLVAVARNLLMS